MGEKDQVKWLGVQPTDPEAIFTRYEVPEGATFVQGYGQGTNGWSTIYTSPTGYYTFITDWGFTVGCTANCNALAQIRTSGPATKIEFALLHVLANSWGATGHNHSVALKMDPDDYIRIYTNNAGSWCNFWYTGYTRAV